MLTRAFALAVLAFGIGGTTGHAAEPSGQAVAVIQAAAAEGANGNRVLEVSAPVFTGDLIRTDAAGEAQLRFLDETRLVVGPNSQLTIDRFVFAGEATAREIAVNTTRGAFRFITGVSQKEAYTINTPTATIGVRGTKFDITVSNEATNLALYEGSVRLCDRSSTPRRCTELSGRCRVLIVAPGQDFRWVNSVYERTALMDTVFPYAFRQSGLRADFRVESQGCAVRDIRRGNHDSPDRRRENPDQGERG